jgi:hypothetical protein
VCSELHSFGTTEEGEMYLNRKIYCLKIKKVTKDEQKNLDKLVGDWNHFC